MVSLGQGVFVIGSAQGYLFGELVKRVVVKSVYRAGRFLGFRSWTVK